MVLRSTDSIHWKKTRRQVTIAGASITGLRPEMVCEMGVVAVPEGHQTLTELTVLENLHAAGIITIAEDWKRAWLTHWPFPELGAKLTVRAGLLSGGRQQMLALAQAIVSRPKFLLADKLSFGLAPVVVSRLVPVVVRLSKEGVGILLIEQFTHIALRLAHHVYVLERGRVRFSGSPDELQANPDILHSAYLSPKEAAVGVSSPSR